MFCNECGAENSFDSKFCSACGKPLNETHGLIARRLKEKQKEKNVFKSSAKTAAILKLLSICLFVAGSVLVFLSFYFATVPFLVFCIICYCICVGLLIAGGVLNKNSKNPQTNKN